MVDLVQDRRRVDADGMRDVKFGRSDEKSLTRWLTPNPRLPRFDSRCDRPAVVA